MDSLFKDNTLPESMNDNFRDFEGFEGFDSGFPDDEDSEGFWDNSINSAEDDADIFNEPFEDFDGDDYDEDEFDEDSDFDEDSEFSGFCSVEDDFDFIEDVHEEKESKSSSAKDHLNDQKMMDRMSQHFFSEDEISRLMN